MAIRLLSDRAIVALKPRAKIYLEPDGANLYLAVLPSGVKTWQFWLRLSGKPDTFTIGKYPDVGLAQSARAGNLEPAGTPLTLQKTRYLFSCRRVGQFQKWESLIEAVAPICHLLKSQSKLLSHIHKLSHLLTGD